MQYKTNNPTHGLLKKEGQFIENGFSGFVESLTDEHMFNQLWMFSKSYDVNEATDNIMSLDLFFMTEHFNSLIPTVNQKIGVDLRARHERRGEEVELDPESMSILREKLEPEYELLTKLGLSNG